MTTQENQTRSEKSEGVESTESAHDSGTGERDIGRYRGNRRTFLQGVGIAGMISLSGCTVDENGIRWGSEDGATDTPVDEPTDTPLDEARGTDEPTDTPVDESTDTPDDETTEEAEEKDLSEYEDGCFSGGTPQASNGVRDGVEITVTPAGVADNIQLVRETIQFEYDDDLVLRDDIDLTQVEGEEEEDDDPMVIEAEYVEVDEEDDETEDEDDPIVVEAQLIEVDDDDEEDDDE